MNGQSMPPPPPPPGPGFPPPRAGTWERPQWSGLAITAFVLSLLGCFGITALAGLILGAVAVFTTGPGKRRGRGFALAAIAVSILYGVGFIVIMTMFFGVVQFAQTNSAQIKAMLSTDTDMATRADAWMAAVATPEFREAVSAADLARWAVAVRAKHGTLVELKRSEEEEAIQLGDQMLTINMRGRFVNGNAPVRFMVRTEGITGLKLNDVTVDGVSPRSRAPEGAATGNP